jgi:hypothetical protein
LAQPEIDLARGTEAIQQRRQVVLVDPSIVIVPYEAARSWFADPGTPAVTALLQYDRGSRVTQQQTG